MNIIYITRTDKYGTQSCKDFNFDQIELSEELLTIYKASFLFVKSVRYFFAGREVQTISFK